jgi:anti-anti-sigma factor
VVDHALSLSADLSRFPRIVSFDEQLGVLHVSGDEDRTTSGRRRRPLSVALRATRDVIVDLSELHFADPSLMIDLACLARRLRSNGMTLWLRHPQPHVNTLIELVGLHRLPSVHVMQPPASAAAPA